MDSIITFEGPGPFHLPVAERVTAVGHSNNGVTMTIYSQLPGRGSALGGGLGNEPVPVSVQMVSRVARELATHLVEAADETDAGQRTAR
jgi:hypothetical protein